VGGIGEDVEVGTVDGTDTMAVGGAA